MLQKDIEEINFPLQSESIVTKGYIQTHDNKLEKMYSEDLAALEPLSDDGLLEEIKNRLKVGEHYSFIGDVLLSMNPNKAQQQYDRKVCSEDHRVSQ
jgi:myosin III